MSNLLLYLLKASVVSGVLYTIYRFTLSNNTFHILNRYILLFVILFSVICPALQFGQSFNTTLKPLSVWINEIEDIPAAQGTAQHSGKFIQTVSVSYVLVRLYVLVTLVLLVRFIYRLNFLFGMRKEARLRSEQNNSFYLTDKIHAPFSFFNWIFIPEAYTCFRGLDSVLRHEKTHAAQWHTFDLLLAEILCIALWFNPFVYFLKKSLKTVHEYLADNEVLRESTSVSDYMKILKTGHELSFISGITNQFTSLTIKKRLKMITKNKTPHIYKLTYILFALSALIMMQSFAQNPPASVVPCIKPIADRNIKKTSGYGMRMHPIYKEMKMHYGIDITAAEGTPVLATADGKVIKTEFEEEGKGYGRVIVIQHDAVYTTLYAQLSGFNVETGDVVKQGDIVGYVGSSGMSTGPHLHYEVIKNNERVDPEDYFNK